MLGNVTILHAVTPKGTKSSVIQFIVWAIRTFFSLLIGLHGYFKGLDKSNSYFIVHGDTVSSLMGSFVAVVSGLKLVHIESGLRSFNFFEPFPEEICRYIISRLADIHFCPNAWSVNNLQGINRDKVNTFENTLIEIFWSAIKTKAKDPFVRQIQKQNKRYFVMVIHRQEHVLFKQEQTKEMIKFILAAAPKKLMCLFLIHDISTNFVHSLSYLIPQEVANNIIKVKRLPYFEFMHLLQGSEFLITDGGSNQEEMYYMGKPCLLLRARTERTEGLNKNVVLSENKKRTIIHFMKNYKDYIYAPIKIRKVPSKIIVDYLFAPNV